MQLQGYRVIKAVAPESDLVDIRSYIGSNSTDNYKIDYVNYESKKTPFRIQGYHEEKKFFNFDKIANSNAQALWGHDCSLFNDSVYMRFSGASKVGEHQNMNWFGWSKFITKGFTLGFITEQEATFTLLVSPGSHLQTNDSYLLKNKCRELIYEPLTLSFGDILIYDSNLSFSIPAHEEQPIRYFELTYAPKSEFESRERYLEHYSALKSRLILGQIKKSFRNELSTP